jgi:hypothetical protein
MSIDLPEAEKENSIIAVNAASAANIGFGGKAAPSKIPIIDKKPVRMIQAKKMKTNCWTGRFLVSTGSLFVMIFIPLITTSRVRRVIMDKSIAETCSEAIAQSFI